MNEDLRRGVEWWAGKLNTLSSLRNFVPPDYEPIIGSPERPLLAKGFPLLIAGDIGVGKSLLAIQAIRSLCLGIPFLGRFPVTKLLPGERLTLLTLDRSYAVTQRLLAATSNTLEREYIDSKISVINDVEQSSIESDPYLLSDIAAAGESKLLIIDGADKLTRNVVDHESGRRLADAVNSLLNAGVDLLMTSHLKKSQKQFNVDGKLSDIYGSMQLPAVVGSVVTLTARKQNGEDSTASSNFHQVKTIKGKPHNGVIAHNHEHHSSGGRHRHGSVLRPAPEAHAGAG